MEKPHLLTQHLASYFHQHGIKMSYKEGHLFTRPEDHAQGIYYLESGLAMLYTTKSDGTEQIIGIWEKGAIFSKEGTVMTQPNIIMSIEAFTKCTVYRMESHIFRTLLTQHHHVLEAYMRQVSFNNVYILRQVMILGERNIYLRVIDNLLLLAEYYGDVDQKGGYTIRILLTQEQLASMLCITREYLNKNLKKIKTKKLINISKKGKIHIPNITLLKQELDISEGHG